MNTQKKQCVQQLTDSEGIKQQTDLMWWSRCRNLFLCWRVLNSWADWELTMSTWCESIRPSSGSTVSAQIRQMLSLHDVTSMLATVPLHTYTNTLTTSINSITWPSSTVPHGFLPSDLQRHIMATTLICQPTTPSRSTLPAKHHRPTGFLCSWSVGVEFFAGLLAQSCYWLRYIQTAFENVYVCFVLAHTEH